MPRSEIDDIFAVKPNTRPAKPSSSSAPPQLPAKPKKSSKKKRKREAEHGVAATGETSVQERPAKRRLPETVLDPSVGLSAPSKKASSVKTSSKAEAVKNNNNKEQENKDEERFKDSRGTGPRRKTDEGFAIYKEDELGITDQGGETPLCPFDCQCCF